MVGIFEKLSGSEYDAFLAVAAALSDDYSFAHTTTKVLAGPAPSVKLFKSAEGKELVFDGEFETSKLQQWVESRAAPLVIELEKWVSSPILPYIHL